MKAPLPVFAGFGIELEYMIVDGDSLAVLPIADRVLRELGGGDEGQVQRGAIGWSNELVLHLIELKNAQPAPMLDGLPDEFERELRQLAPKLAAFGARLMPTAMHPWMDPLTATRLWPHQGARIYNTFDRIFDCRSHGWANLQSMHINLPFANDAEFARLHTAIRLVLPLLPALAASSPIAEGQQTGFMDYRLEVYRNNAPAFPSITGQIIPELIHSRAEYEARILAPMYRDIAPYDPQGVLRHEWLNSRGAIARFDRNTIEIRVADVQECVHADLAIAAATAAVVRALYEHRWSTMEAQGQLETEALAGLLLACIREAEQASIEDGAYLRLFGFPGTRCRAGDLWRYLVGAIEQDATYRRGPWAKPLHFILERGTLARRIADALGEDTSQAHLREIYSRLCACLERGEMYSAA